MQGNFKFKCWKLKFIDTEDPRLIVVYKKMQKSGKLSQECHIIEKLRKKTRPVYH